MVRTERVIICKTKAGFPVYGPEDIKPMSVRQEWSTYPLDQLINRDRFSESLRYKWSEEIQKPEHAFNWAGVVFGLCNLLMHDKVCFSQDLIRKIPKDWRPELVKYAIIGTIKRGHV